VDFQVYEDMFPCIFYFESTEIHSNIFFLMFIPVTKYIFVSSISVPSVLEHQSNASLYLIMTVSSICDLNLYALFLLTLGHHEHHFNGLASLI
jgi:hypothetical protein